MKIRLAVLSVLSGLLLAACIDGPSAANWRFRGTVDNLDEAPEVPPVLQIENVASGTVAITGGVTTPCWNDLVTLDGARNGTTLSMAIERTPQQQCTDPRTRHHIFVGIFSLLNPGDYTFRVIDGTGETPVVRLETRMNVK